MKNKDFAVFILTHGRPDNVITYNTLKRCGYTGDVYIIIDNEDKTSERYYENFGDKVVIFDKKEIAKTFDEGDNFDDRRAIVYARNACFDIARKKGIRYFAQLDDDYTSFYFTADENYDYSATRKKVLNLDDMFYVFLDFYKKTNIKSVAFAQGGDFIGGENSGVFTKKIARKCMNSFFCSVDRPFNFLGRINEDVNTYTRNGSIGHIFFTLAWIRLEQKQTQSNDGGMTDIYLDGGTYIKSFYTVLFSPSCCKVSLMGDTNQRLHHRISWNNAVPVIIDEKYRKTK
jgi:hypothetical protein